MNRVRFELAYYYAVEGGQRGVECLRDVSLGRSRRACEKYHEAEVGPLMEEVAVDVDAVGLAQVLGDQRADGRQVLFLERMLVLDVAQLGGKTGVVRCCGDVGHGLDGGHGGELPMTWAASGRCQRCGQRCGQLSPIL